MEEMDRRRELERLRQRRRKIVEHLASLYDGIGRCQADLRAIDQREEELLAINSEKADALRVEGKALSVESIGPGRRRSAQRSTISSTRPNREKGTPRPLGVPRIPDMVMGVLREEKEHGRAGLHGIQIINAINDRWWPGVS